MKSFIALLLVAFTAAVLADDMSMVLRGSSPFSGVVVEELSIADLITHNMGISPIHQSAERSLFPQKDLFNAPKANLFVAVDSVSQAMANHEFFKTGQTLEVRRQHSPQDSLTAVTTLVTGAPAAVHGIYGHSWSKKAHLVEAFGSPLGEVKVAKITDRVAQTFKSSGSFVISADRQFAAALATHPDLALEARNRAYFFDANKGAFVPLFPVHSDSEVNVNKDSIVQFVRNLAELQNDRFVQLGNAQFDLADSADLLFFAELTAFSTVQPTPSGHGVDFLAVGVSSIRGLVLKYGAASAQTQKAMSLIAEALSKFEARVNGAYDSKLTTQVVMLGSNTAQTTATAAMASSKAAIATAEQKTYTAAQVNTWQAGFWTSIGLIAALIAIGVFTGSMESGQNTILYRVQYPSGGIPDKH